jgi:hypothetical protein
MTGRPGSRWRKRLLGVGLLAVIVYAHQWSSAYSPERNRLQKSHHSAQVDLEKAEVVAERWSQFVDQYLERERELAELRRRLPSVSRMPSFVGQIQGLAEELGVALEPRSAPTSEAFDFYWQHRFSFALSGPETAVPLLQQRVLEAWPLATWVEEGERSEGRGFGLVLWSAAESHGGYESPCPRRGAPWLLWPYSRWVSDLREDLTASCGALEQSRAVLEQIARFEAIAHDVETSRSIIAHLERSPARGGSNE